MKNLIEAEMAGPKKEGKARFIVASPSGISRPIPFDAAAKLAKEKMGKGEIWVSVFNASWVPKKLIIKIGNFIAKNTFDLELLDI